MNNPARLATLVACVAALICGFAASAMASVGQITKAQVNADGTEAEIAGSVTWAGCVHQVLLPKEPRKEKPPIGWPEGPEEKIWPSPYCGWIPFATLGPGSTIADCSSVGRQNPEQQGDGVVLVWFGAERRDIGSEEFDLSGVSLDATSQLICLSAVEIAPSRDFACAFYVGFECPPYRMARFPLVFASASLEFLARGSAPPDPSPGGSSAGGSSADERAASPPPRIRRCANRRDKAMSSRASRCKRHRHQKNNGR